LNCGQLDGGTQIVGVGSYFVTSDHAAEVAFVVDDQLHGKGIATALLEQLARSGTDAALERFTATVLPENSEMLAVFRDSGLWSPEVREERARAQGISVADIEEFYRKRNILGVSVLPEDVAEAVLFLASDRAAKTTGCTLTIDGGVRDAFPR